MAWEHLAVTKPHLVYIILGGFTSLFMLCSSVIKERLYIGEATVATLCGIIFGPHAADLINPMTWGNTDLITLEFSRIVLVVQCFAVGVELPRAYMEKHWKSVTLLLIPVMTFGWLVTSLFIWWMFKSHLNWLDSLCVAACVTATDPVLASSVVGKGKFAKRVPKHLRDLLSAESGCNDGMAFPFIYLAIYLIRYRPDAGKVSLHWFCYTILYECIFGAFYGVVIGYMARRAIRYAHEKDLIDRESFLVFYFVLALFCAGSGSMLGVDDLLVGFSCGVGFSNDGWFLEKTEESHVSNVIDLLINLAFFVYFGTIIPWEQYNSDIIGTTPWRLVVVGLLVLFFRRIPIMMALKPIIPDIKTWREALFAGHFGPIGVGGIFVAIMARAELETESTTPLGVLPPPGFPHRNIIELIWPITTFLVICSIIVHGSSIAVFTLGKHINTLTLTLSYTTANEDGPSWMDRLPRIQSRSKSSMSLRRPSESSVDEKSEFPAGSGLLGPIGLPGQFLRRQKEEESSSRASSVRPSTRRRKWDQGLGPGGPVSQSAIAPERLNRDHADVPSSTLRDSDTLVMNSDENPDSPESSLAKEKQGRGEPEEEFYQEGDKTVIEDEEGNVLAVRDSKGETDSVRAKRDQEAGRRLMREKDVEHGVAQTEHGGELEEAPGKAIDVIKEGVEHPGKSWRDVRKRVGSFRGHRQIGSEEPAQPPKAHKPAPKRGPALAYQFGNTIIVEDEDGEVLKKYDIPGPAKRPTLDRMTSFTDGGGRTMQRLRNMGTYLGVHPHQQMGEGAAGPSSTTHETSEERRKKRREDESSDDEHIRFTVKAGGRRMSKNEFIQQISKMDPKSRQQLVEASDVPEDVKHEARRDAREHAARTRAAAAANIPPVLHSSSHNSSNNNGSNNNNNNSDGALQPELHHIPPSDARADARRTGPDGLTLVDSADRDIPFHSVSATLASYQLDRSHPETAAQRRRREATHHFPRAPPAAAAGDADADADAEPETPDETPVERRRRIAALGGERAGAAGAVSPASTGSGGGSGAALAGTGAGAGTAPGTGATAPHPRSRMAEEETEAEKRRRLGALGIAGAEGAGSSDSSDEEEAGDPLARGRGTHGRERERERGAGGAGAGAGGAGGAGGAPEERPRLPGIRFAELPEIGSRSNTGNLTGGGSPRLRWGEDVGRKGKR